MENGGGGGGGGGPAPFLLKTYEMVDDAATDSIVSWSASRKSFVVWNPPEFARVLLPSYFKHNNFSSFIRQLNTYGFRKIDPERWEFSNEDFVKGQKHNLKNIHRRKPIHSHSQPQGSVDPERAAFEEEIDKLTREKTVLEGKVLGYEEQKSSASQQLENLTHRIANMEQRQERLLTFLEKAVQNPEFIELLAQKIESMDFSAYKKKRRLPELEHSQSVEEHIIVDHQSCSRSEFENISPQDFCSKLRLELSPAVSDINLPSRSTHCSSEDGTSPLGRTEGLPKEDQIRTASFSCCPEILELSDTGESFTLKMDSSLSCKPGPVNPKLHSIQPNLASTTDEDDLNISCLLNLSLASSPLELNKSQNLDATPLSSQDLDVELRPGMHSNNTLCRSSIKTAAFADNHTSTSSHDVQNNKQAVVTTPKQVNDVFWEQFLTEKPGCSDAEESRPNSYHEQEERKLEKEVSREIKGVEHLTL